MFVNKLLKYGKQFTRILLTVPRTQTQVKTYRWWYRRRGGAPRKYACSTLRTRTASKLLLFVCQQTSRGRSVTQHIFDFSPACFKPRAEATATRLEYLHGGGGARTCCVISGVGFLPLKASGVQQLASRQHQAKCSWWVRRTFNLDWSNRCRLASKQWFKIDFRVSSFGWNNAEL